MILPLSKLPADTPGTYEIDGVEGKLPERALYLAPDAALDFADLVPTVTCSDIYRSPEGSLDAIHRRKGALPPGLSPHNFGKAIDIAIGPTAIQLRQELRARKVTKPDLDAWMAERGWHCFRTDGKLGRSADYPSDESWHYNHLGRDVVVDPARWRTTGGWIEAIIVGLHGASWRDMTVGEAQLRLRSIRFYGGRIDGDPGPLTRQAVAAFRRAWALPEGTALDERTRRVLAVVTAERRIVSPGTELAELSGPIGA